MIFLTLTFNVFRIFLFVLFFFLPSLVVNIQLVDWALDVRVVTTTEEGVRQTSAVKAGREEDEDTSDDDKEDDDSGPPGGEVAELLKHATGCHPLIVTIIIIVLFISCDTDQSSKV